MMRALVASLVLLIAIVIPIYYYDLIFMCVGNLSMGWVFSSIFLRILVIALTAIFVKQIFFLFKKSRDWRSIWAFLIALPVGFGISFITPIYNSDYGDLSDNESLNFETLDAIAPNVVIKSEEHKIIGFFSTDCGHCKVTAFFLGVNKEAGQKIPVYAFFNDNTENVSEFIQENNGHHFITHVIPDMNSFLQLSGAIFPSVFLLNESNNTLKHWSGDVLNFSALDELLAIES